MEESEPGPRLIRSARDAEEVACTWLRYWGHDDAALTGYGADEGIDVQGLDVVAQVKAEVKPVGRPVIQSLAGVAAVEAKLGVFFALGGYTTEALSWASRAGVAAFTFDLSGMPEPLNEQARELASGATRPGGGEASGTAYRFSSQFKAQPLPGPWAQPLPEQDLYAESLQPGDRADPRRLAVTFARLCLEQSQTVAGRSDRLWTPHHRYLWSVDMMDLDGTVNGALEVYHLALPQWRHGKLPQPVPDHFVHYDVNLERDEELQEFLLAGLTPDEVAAQQRIDEIGDDATASQLALRVEYTDAPWQTSTPC